jgi:hypothetical protein
MRGKMASNLLKSLKKGEILHLRDDFRPFMKKRYWVFQDLFESGGIFLHHKSQGFIQVKEEDIDWQEYKGRKFSDPKLPDKSK